MKRAINCNILKLQSRLQITPLRPVFEPLHQTIYVFFPVLGLNNARTGIRRLHFYSSRTYSSHEHSIGKNNDGKAKLLAEASHHFRQSSTAL